MDQKEVAQKIEQIKDIHLDILRSEKSLSNDVVRLIEFSNRLLDDLKK